MPRDHSSFVKSFFLASDNGIDHDAYVAHFTPAATLRMGLKTATGHEQIRTLRRSMWAHVSRRRHEVAKMYPSVTGEDELMLFGTVEYALANGKELETEWAARMVFGERSPDKLEFYQVWTDASPVITAMGKRIEPDASGVGMSIVDASEGCGRCKGRIFTDRGLDRTF